MLSATSLLLMPPLIFDAPILLLRTHIFATLLSFAACR